MTDSERSASPPAEGPPAWPSRVPVPPVWRLVDRGRAAVGGFLRRHGIVALAIAVALVVNAAVMTDGTFELTARESHFTEFFDELGRSILHGRFDVPQKTLEHEAFLIGGRAYGYFGPTPALARIPLDFLFPSMRGRWARWLILTCHAITLIAFYSLYRRAGRLLGRPADLSPGAQYAAGALILALSLGSTLFFISRRSVIYHESIGFGGALSMVSYVLLLRYLDGARVRALMGAILCALFAFMARAPVGSGPLFALGVVGAGMLLSWVGRLGGPGHAADGSGSGPRGRIPRALATLGLPDHARVGRHLVALTLVLGAGLALCVYRNIRTVGNLTGSPPLNHHVSLIGNPTRLARTKGNFIQPANLLTSLRAYFRADGIVIRPKYPWFSPPDRSPAYPEAHLDYQEPLVSFPCGYPFWAVLVAVGVAALAWPRRPEALGGMRLVVLAGAVGFLPTAISAALSLRYMHDVFPFVAAGGAVGIQQLLVFHGRWRWARMLMPLLVVLGLYTCAVSAIITVGHPRW